MYAHGVLRRLNFPNRRETAAGFDDEKAAATTVAAVAEPEQQQRQRCAARRSAPGSDHSGDEPEQPATAAVAAAATAPPTVAAPRAAASPTPVLGVRARLSVAEVHHIFGVSCICSQVCLPLVSYISLSHAPTRRSFSERRRRAASCRESALSKDTSASGPKL